LRLEAELFLLRDSRYVPVGLVVVAALEILVLLPLTAGNVMLWVKELLSCFAAGISSAFSVICPPLLLFAPFLFHVRLSLRRNEVIDDGVGGSSGLDMGAGDFGGCRVIFNPRGPDGFVGIEGSAPTVDAFGRSPPVFDLVRTFDSTKSFGTDDDKNGDTPDRSSCAVKAVVDSDELASAGEGLSGLTRCIVLLLRRVLKSILSSGRFLEKKLLFDAVIGVVGVLIICRAGGLILRSDELCPCRAAIFSTVGALKGPRAIGGRRNGCRLFPVPFCSALVLAIDFLVLAFLLTFAGGSVTLPDILPVELLCMLLAS
jgi:hypothetical protein